MTPERIKELARIQASRNRPYYPDETIEVLGDEWFALLAIAQRAGETCEWVEVHLPGGAIVGWHSEKHGMKYLVQEMSPNCCPQCGRTVAVRDGRT